jgi:hypothetical protein
MNNVDSLREFETAVASAAQDYGPGGGVLLHLFAIATDDVAASGERDPALEQVRTSRPAPRKKAA